MDLEKKKTSREEELDRFWDIASLVPQKKRAPSSAPAADTATAEIELPPQKTSYPHDVARAEPVPPAEAAPKRRFIPPHTAEEERWKQAPLEEYTPENTLIRRVRIYRPKSNYQYYEAFLHDAIRLYPIHGEECGRVTFFSYVPQYSQMNRAQLEWYLWWRECVRNKEYLQTDYSYVLLYLYELVNLSSRLDPQETQAAMVAVWENYRDMYHQLDGYLAEWICDHGLLHRLSASKLPPKLLAAAMTHGTLKEFYFVSDPVGGYAGALTAFCNNYDYTKSKFYPPNSALFDACIPKVLNLIVESLSGEGKLFSNTRMDDSRLVRNAFSGALCAYSLKRNIEVEYCSFSRSNELRYFITDVIKYTENLLRAHLGIRSRLSVYSLSAEVRERIDLAVASLLPPRPIQTKIKRAEEVAEYEKLYDLPRTPFSLANAAEIERASWSTTERLVEAFEENEPPILTVAVAPSPVAKETPEDALTGELSVLLSPYASFLQAILDGDPTRQSAIAKEMGKLSDAVVDAINEIAVEQTGDILLEDDGEGAYAVIPDYTELIQEVLNGDS